MAGQKGFSGISFPFRFSGSGGVVRTTTDVNDFTHIQESIRQIILTMKGERVFESKLGSEIPRSLFNISDDETDRELMKFYIHEALQIQEKRVEVIDIKVLTVESEYDQSNKLVVDIEIRVNKYLKNQVISIDIPTDGGMN